MRVTPPSLAGGGGRGLLCGLIHPISHTNHSLTIYQRPHPSASLILVNKLATKELHFGNPLPLALCYPIQRDKHHPVDFVDGTKLPFAIAEISANFANG